MRVGVFLLLVTAALLQAGGSVATHQPSCEQSHEYSIANDAYVNPDPGNLEFGAVDIIELPCPSGWDHWPVLGFQSWTGMPCWWMRMESPQLAILTIGTACVSFWDVDVSTFGVVRAW